MSEVVQNAEHEFWRAPAPGVAAASPKASQEPVDACGDCGTEFLLGAGFCHVCGAARQARRLSRAGWGRLPQWSSWVGQWLRHLEFVQIKEHLGLPTASMVAFLVGVGCVLAAVLTGVIFSASTVLDWQAVQVWRIEWLLAAVAAFLAGILLKRPSTR